MKQYTPEKPAAISRYRKLGAMSCHSDVINFGKLPYTDFRRVLKKGGTFALHDIFPKTKYGDMQAFVRKLRDVGYQRVELIDTTGGRFMKKSEAAWMGLSGSAPLTGIK